MKVLQINATINWGSTGRIAEEIGLNVMKNGGKSYIIYGRYGNPSSSIALNVGNKLDFYLHALQTRIFDNHGLASNKNSSKIIDLINDIKPNIIHLHNLHGYYLNYSRLFKYLSQLNIPIVWTLHDCWAYTGHCSHYSFKKCYLWKNQCHDCIQKKAYPCSYIFDRSRQNYIDKKKAFTSVKNMTIVPVSNWLAREINDSFLNKYPIKVIHNGVDTSIFSPKEDAKNKLGLNSNFIILGVASIWNDRKGLEDFIKLRKLLSHDYTIIMIGLTQKQIDKLPIGIVGIKRTNNVSELAQYYSAADVYINLSVEETFGMTTCESLACGTPVIVYNSTACPEIVSNDVGYVVEPGDLQSVISCINKIKEKGKNTYKNKCRENIIKYYNKERKFEEYIQLYKDILKK